MENALLCHAVKLVLKQLGCALVAYFLTTVLKIPRSRLAVLLILLCKFDEAIFFYKFIIIIPASLAYLSQ